MFLKGLSEVFLSPSSCRDDIPTHYLLCKDVLSVYTTFATELGSKTHPEVWYFSFEQTGLPVLKFHSHSWRMPCRHVLQMTILETAFALLHRSNPDENAFANTVADEVFLMKRDVGMVTSYPFAV